MDFITIDFETANSRLAPCSMGLVLVENNKFINEHHFLINPDQPFSRNNTKIHGITSATVQNSPLFSEVWGKTRHYFERYPVVAHNAAYDRKVLEKVLRRYKLLHSILPIVYYDTMALYRHNYPQAQAADLSSVCAAFGVEFKAQHNALGDAKATSQVMIAMLSIPTNAMFPSLVSGIYLDDKNNVLDEKQDEVKNKQPFGDEHTPDYATTTAAIDETQISFNDKAFVITGSISGYERSDIEEQISKHGGRVLSGVSKKVDYVVVGLQDVSVVKDSTGAKSNKIIKAEALREKGHDIKIVSAEAFIKALQEKVEVS